MSKKTILSFILNLVAFFAFAQSHVPKEFLVEFKQQDDARTVLHEFSTYKGKQTKLQLIQQLVPDMNIWHLKYEQDEIEEEALLQALQAHPTILHAQYNHLVKQRSITPNDPQFSSQWQYVNTGQGGGTVGMDIDANLAWDISTGGLTAGGDTIVVAVIDDGANILHPDLQANLWVNRFEIPNNGFDDDGNGYVDDYLGWNTNTSDDNVGSNGAGAHGTSVAGIIGAVGNNNVGVTGVNWKIKMMLIRNNFNASEANVLIAYGYALSQRKRYNNSNGQDGAFVVATNASWGVDNGNPAQAPLWCAFYDTLGKYGIINVASTTNNSVNVDAVGDLPTSCPSDYLISVANLNRFGLRNGGYGANSIDLGAFAEGAFTLTYGGYGSFGGTSAAAPHVTGAVALAYSAACGKFMSLARRYPNQAALLMKRAILDGTVANSALNSLSLTGGQLNLFNSLQEIQNACPLDSCFAPFGLNLLSLSDSSALIDWAGGADTTCLRMRLQGSNVWLDSVLTTQYSYLCDSLARCKHYEIYVSGWCNGALGNTELINFQTTGCCLSPTQLQVLSSSDFSANISWLAASAATGYQLRWREYGQAAWNFISLGTVSTYNFINLNPCTFYELQIRTDCGDTLSSYSSTLFFATMGCTSCAGASYCTMNGTTTAFDWIESFRFGIFSHRSGPNAGYYLYDSTFLMATAGASIPISIAQGNDFQEAVRVWIDFNRDGDFADWEEKVFEGIINFTDSISGFINIPYYVSPGVTRLRLALQWSTLPTLCTQYQNGETEDYCIQILPETAVSEIEATDDELVIYPNPSNGLLTISNIPVDAYSLRLFDIRGVLLWEQKLASDNIEGTLQIALPEISGLYLLELQTAYENQVFKVVRN